MKTLEEMYEFEEALRLKQEQEALEYQQMELFQLEEGLTAQ